MGLAAVWLNQCSEKHVHLWSRRALYQVACFTSYPLFPAISSPACSEKLSAEEGQRAAGSSVQGRSAPFLAPRGRLPRQLLDLTIPLRTQHHPPAPSFSFSRPLRGKTPDLSSPWNHLTCKILNSNTLFSQLKLLFFQVSHSFIPTKPPSPPQNMLLDVI